MNTLKHFSLLFFFSSAYFIQGCSSPERNARIINVASNGVHAITYPSDIRGAYFIKKNSDVRVCAEPAPDVSLESLQKLTANLTAKISTKNDIDGKLSSELSAKVVQLAGRTELLLLARELLYRACEISVNTQIDNESVLSLYKQVADLVSDLGKGDKAEAEANKAKAESELLREKAARKKAGDIIDGKKDNENE